MTRPLGHGRIAERLRNHEGLSSFLEDSSAKAHCPPVGSGPCLSTDPQARGLHLGRQAGRPDTPRVLPSAHGRWIVTRLLAGRGLDRSLPVGTPSNDRRARRADSLGARRDRHQS
jgi:hypothetical protein